MNNSSFLPLFQNAAMLLALAFLFDLTATYLKIRRVTWWQVPLGFLIGGIGVIIMLTPWMYIPGIIFDTRSILLGISGLFFGAIPTLIAMAITAALRISLGGPATLMGVSVIFATGFLGIAWRAARKRPLTNISWKELLLFGIVLHVSMLACTILLPRETASRVFATIALPVLSIYPIVTMALGALLANRLKSNQVSDNLLDREERLRLVVGASNIGFFERDLRTQQVHFSNEWLKQIGYAQGELSNQISEWETRLHPDDRERVLSAEDDFIKGLRNAYEMQYRLRHKDGSYRWILARSQRQVNSQGEPVKLLGCHIDLSEQMRAQEATETSERRFRGLAESSQDYIMLYDRQYRHVYENPAALRVSGLILADIIGKTHLEAGFNKELSALWEADIQHVFSTGSTTQRLFEWDSAEGTVYLDLRLYPVYGSNNEIDHVLGISRDITSLKKAEHALQKSEELYRVLTENIQDVVWILDTETMYFRYVSPSVERQRGYSVEEIMAAPIEHALTEKDRSQLIELIQQRAAERRSGKETGARFYSQELEQPCKNGTTIWTEVVTNYYINPENGHVEVRGITRDISVRKQVEKQREAAIVAMRESETQYRSLFDNMLNGFAYCHMLYSDAVPTDFIYINVNRAFTQLTGLKDVVGKKVSEVIPGIRESDPLLFDIYGRVAQTGMPESFETYVESLRDWYSISVYSPGKDDFVAIFDVITERKRIEENLYRTQAELERQLAASDQSRRVLLSMVEDQRIAEEQIRRLNNELEQRVQVRTAQLQSANKELEAFAYSVSHDLRAPLRAMDGFSEALLADYRDRLDDQAEHYLNRIREASQRMGQLINDLLDLSRISRTQMSVNQVNLSEMVRTISTELQARDATRKVEFDIAPDVIVEGDAALLEIAIGNLLNNAYKFTGKQDHARICLGVTEISGDRVYFIRDNGAGFNMAYAAQLFTPFQRLHAADEFPGTGIGLVTVQRVIARHGGRIWPEAELNHGATFYFTLGDNHE